MRTPALARLRNRSAVAVLIFMGVVAAGCGASHPSSSTTSSSTGTTTTTVPISTTTTAPVSTTVSLYFLRGAYLGVAHRSEPQTSAVGTAALTTLVDGPDSSEAAGGLSSAIPPGTKLISLHIASETATVDFNDAFAVPAAPGDELARVAQVVYTLTQFPTVSAVVFQIAGTTPATFASGAVSVAKPLGRQDVLGALPAILVETPAVGDSLYGSVHLSGEADVFEAQFDMQLIGGDGRILIDQSVHATAGTGTWGTFDVTVPFDTPTTTIGTLRIYDVSAKDGSAQDEVDLHLPVGP